MMIFRNPPLVDQHLMMIRALMVVVDSWRRTHPRCITMIFVPMKMMMMMKYGQRPLRMNRTRKSPSLDADIQELLNDFDAALATPSPTNAPTKEPTVAPTNPPTEATSAPTKSPTYYPSSLVEKIEDEEDEIEAWEETLEEDE